MSSKMPAILLLAASAFLGLSVKGESEPEAIFLSDARFETAGRKCFGQKLAGFTFKPMGKLDPSDPSICTLPSGPGSAGWSVGKGKSFELKRYAWGDAALLAPNMNLKFPDGIYIDKHKDRKIWYTMKFWTKSVGECSGRRANRASYTIGETAYEFSSSGRWAQVTRHFRAPKNIKDSDQAAALSFTGSRAGSQNNRVWVPAKPAGCSKGGD